MERVNLSEVTGTKITSLCQPWGQQPEALQTNSPVGQTLFLQKTRLKFLSKITMIMISLNYFAWMASNQ